MTRRTNARIAGATFLAYIALGISQMVLGRSTSSADISKQLVLIAGHVMEARVNVLLSIVIGFVALSLGVALYALTRDEDRDIALIALVCRIGEGMLGIFPLTGLAMLWLATSTTGSPSLDPAAGTTLATFLVALAGWKVTMCATLFAAGSLLFCYLLLRGRIIPVGLAWVGVFASLILVIALPLQLAGILAGPVTQMMWLPMLFFEVPVGVWLILKGGNDRPRPSIQPSFAPGA
jgi:hypothetical protein